jgi:hypothetical protein
VRLNAVEAGILNDRALDTPEATHYAAVLLNHLRQIKAAANTADPGMTGILNQNAGDGGVNETNRNWLNGATNETAINTHLTDAAVTADQLAALQEFAAAARIDDTEGKGLAWAHINTEGGDIATKILTKANTLNFAAFRDIRVKDNRVDRNYNTGQRVGETAGEAVITAYDAKGVDKRTAALLYNVGIDSADLADTGTGGDLDATTFKYRPIHAEAVGVGTDVIYDLTDAAGLINFVTARSLDKDPLNGDGKQP